MSAVARLDAGVLRDDLALVGALDHPHQAVGVAGQMGEDVADRPAGKQRRLTCLGIGQLVDICQERLMRGGATGDVSVELAPGVGFLHET